jgi:hypothetical protein
MAAEAYDFDSQRGVTDHGVWYMYGSLLDGVFTVESWLTADAAQDNRHNRTSLLGSWIAIQVCLLHRSCTASYGRTVKRVSNLQSGDRFWLLSTVLVDANWGKERW